MDSDCKSLGYNEVSCMYVSLLLRRGVWLTFASSYETGGDHMMNHLHHGV